MIGNKLSELLASTSWFDCNGCGAIIHCTKSLDSDIGLICRNCKINSNYLLEVK